MENNSPETASTAPSSGKACGWWWRSWRWLVRLGYLAVMAGLFGMFLKCPPPLTSTVLIVDAQGKPVAGAELMFLGLRDKTKRVYWGWDVVAHGDRGPYKAAVNGLVEFPYPIHVIDTAETGDVSVEIRKDGFVPLRTWIPADQGPPISAGARAQVQHGIRLLVSQFKGGQPASKLTLQPAATLEFTATLDGRRVEPERLIPMLQGIEALDRLKSWTVTGEGVLHNAQIASTGELKLMAAYVPVTGPISYGGPITFNPVPGSTNRFEVELRPGVRLTGRLSVVVPRPVKNGRVHVWSGTTEIMWQTWTTVDETGNFVFESLPFAGVQLAGTCEGFVSANEATDLIKRAMPGAYWPQKGYADPKGGPFVLSMVPESRCEVRVMDTVGQPLRGALVSLEPLLSFTFNVHSFPGERLRAEDILYEGRIRQYLRQMPYNNAAITGADGTATVDRLIAMHLRYYVTHEDYAMPVSPINTNKVRFGLVLLKAGETVRQSVSMEKKTPGWMMP